MGYFENYSQQEIAQIVRLSTSYKDFARKIGYSNSPSGDTIKAIKEKLASYDTEHFTTNNKIVVERTVENTFIVNSTASQKSLRKLYYEGNYTSYQCAICGQLPIWQGKELTLILDHIDGINNNDVLDNLRWVCPNCNQQLETTGSKNPNRKIIAKKYYCQDCGKEISKNSVRCVECNSKHSIIPLEQMLVTRDELKQLIRTTPFTQIGKKYGVTDNAVRKWCDKYNLPRKVTDIKKYSDEDWFKL